MLIWKELLPIVINIREKKETVESLINVFKIRNWRKLKWKH